MITKQLISKLHCIKCFPPSSKLKLIIYEMKENRIIRGKLECNNCKKNYPIENGIPSLIAKKNKNKELWKVWEDHLAGFERRRESNSKRTFVLDQVNKNTTSESFFDFIGKIEGDWLDLGCGPGKKRHYVNHNKVIYYGLDPLPHPLRKDFYYVQAVTERIPFQNDMFDNITAIAALDHFAALNLAFEEIRRVLKPTGRFHILQSVYDINGPISAVKVLAHLIKDLVEMTNVKKHKIDTVKHMTNFKQKSLIESLNRHFKIDKIQLFSPKWYVPYKVFLTARIANR